MIARSLARSHDVMPPAKNETRNDVISVGVGAGLLAACVGVCQSAGGGHDCSDQIE